MSKILFVMTGADHWTLSDGTKHPTGYWADEFEIPYRAFVEAGHEVDVATPGGVTPTADSASLDGNPAPEMPAAASLADVDPGDYDAVFYPGGHGPMEDLATDADSARIINAAMASGTPLALVCHGVAALNAVDPAGRRVTGFTNAEETQAGLAAGAPWLVQTRLTELGATFVEADPWTPHVVVDGTLITGQNPQSAAAIAAEVLRVLPDSER